MHDNNWQEYATTRRPLIDTGRKPIPIERFPKDLDFSKTIGDTRFIVTSHFKKDAGECMLTKINRMVFHE